jgi:NAD(P)-dependent dehydrogenase (short-subunit alcohol dehydrogenase family)
MEQLDGRVCAITGGASGIGLAMAIRFRQAGMKIAIGDIEAGALANAVDALGGGDDVHGVLCDVTSPASNTGFHDAVLDRFGAVHVVGLNAGVAASGSLLDTTLSSWRWMIEVNILGIVNGLAAFGPTLVAQGEGHIVCTASASGLLSAPALGAYGATKHAVVGLAGVLRDELAPSGVGVSVVCPGVVRTRIFESERNRPAALDGITHTDPVTAGTYLEAAEGAPGPDLVANAVHDAVLADQLFVLPSPEVSGLIMARMDEVRAALPPKRG